MIQRSNVVFSVALLVLFISGCGPNDRAEVIASEDSVHLTEDEQVPEFQLPSERRVLKGADTSAWTVGDLQKNEIAITLDDGPSPQYNAFVLKTLRDHGVKATFFLVGWRAKLYPELVKNILREGHVVANHSWKHPQMNRISAKRAYAEIEETQNLLANIAAEINLTVEPLFRFPYGAGAHSKKMRKLLSKFGMRNFHWAMSTHDSRTQNSAVAFKTFKSQLDKHNNGILLMHETHVAGVKALPKMLLELKRRNYNTVTYTVEK